MASYSLSDQAQEDLVDIFEEGVVSFGFLHAVRYHDRLEYTLELLASAPGMARLRTEFGRPLRIHPVGSHIIVYASADDGSVHIVRVRHAREDWASDPVSVD